MNRALSLTVRSAIKLLFCALIAEMDLAVNSLINVFFISRNLGTEGAAAYELVMPCLMVVSAVMALGYNGMQAVCAKDYGAGDRESFERHKNAGYTWMLVVMLGLTLLLALSRDPMLELLGASEGSAALAALCRECYTMFLPCFVLQGLFCMASCLLFLEERRQLVTANLILYGCLLTGNILVTAIRPTMTNYIAVNALSEAAADGYIFLCCFSRRRHSLSAFTGFHLRIADVRELFWTGLPDFMEYVFVAALYFAENLYILHRFSESIVAGISVFEAIENQPEMLCVGFCFLVTSSYGTRVGRVLKASSSEEERNAKKELSAVAKKLTRGAICGAAAAAVLLLLLARPATVLFFSGARDSAEVHSAVLLTVSYALGFVFYILNSELACYYKIVEAYSLAHITFFVEALFFPLVAKILLGEMFGVTGFCLGGAAAEAMTFALNLCFAWRACGHFPRQLADFRQDRYLRRLRERQCRSTS